MRHLKNSLLAFFVVLFVCSCSDSKEQEQTVVDPVDATIDPIYRLMVDATNNPSEVRVRWINPDNKSLIKAEISFVNKSQQIRYIANPLLVDAEPGSIGNIVIELPSDGVYSIQVVAINKVGLRSSPVFTEYNLKNGVVSDHSSIFLSRADSMMSSLIQLYLGGRYDAWNEKFPNATGPYWDGIAAVWGQGAGFSAYTTIKKASGMKSERLSQKYAGYDDRLFTSIERFKNNLSGRGSYAYGTFLGDNDERFYDDNLWIGIDMADLYVETKQERYLDRAKMVWEFILEGTDSKIGGGVYWKEGAVSKHTCSTAPAAVLALKLHEITGQEEYLNKAKELYKWCKDVLQDPSDYLYWDNARLTNENDPNSALKIEKTKYSYNSGQPMQVAALLYKITGEEQYLKDAQNIAEAAYQKWFLTFKSYVLGETIQILDSGDTWFQAIMFRGYVDLYHVDNDRKYIDAYANTMRHAWQSNCRDKGTNLMSDDFRGYTSKTSWSFLAQAACVEILARLAMVDTE